VTAHSGRLEDHTAAELLRTLARTSATGKLTLTRRDRHAILVFRSGRIIYAASSAMRETFGNILVLRGLVTEADLLEALERQHQAEAPVRLGNVLVEMGKVDEKALREVMRRQTEDVIAELARWKGGFFRFDPLAVAEGGEVEVDVKDFVLADGFSAQEMLGDTTPPALDPVGPLARGGVAAATLEEIVPLMSSPTVTAEVTLRLMRFASQILSRGVLFVVRDEELRGMGQFGVEVPGHLPADQVRETVVPLGEPSVFRDAVDRRETRVGPLADSRWNRHLVHRLGGQEPAEAVVIPMVVGGTVAIVFYGDNLPDNRPIGPVDNLEFMMAEAGVALERALVNSRERSLEQMRKA
jgi:Domain of unknown function (DUF4388)